MLRNIFLRPFAAQRNSKICRSLITASLAITIAVLQSGTRCQADTTPAAGMLRYPDVSASHIVFSYAGNLWTVSRTGGVATPLASANGMESFPKFNAAGDRIAFVGNYDGGTDIYVMPTVGGVAQRMTYHSAGETLCDWTPDEALLFSSNALAGLGRMTQLFTVSAEQPLPNRLAVPYGSNGTISPDGKWLAYTPYSRDTRTWKRYRGGMASDIWMLNLETGRSQQVTTWEGTDTLPMWHRQAIYYLSDDGPQHRLNIWMYDTNSGARKQITKYADYDVKWPSIGPGPDGDGEIVLQHGAELVLLDLKTEETTAVEVRIPGDRPKLRPQIIDAAEYVSSAAISPSGKRIAVEARGDIWTAPAKHGTPRNLTGTPGIAERYPAWSPDKRWIAYFSDATGEYELTIKQSDGRGETRRLTDNGSHWRYSPNWSPDSAHLAFTDKTGALLLHTIEGGKTAEISVNPSGDQPAYSWSHDSNYIAYTKSKDDYSISSSIWIYNLSDGSNQQLTQGYFNESNPTFDAKGDFLYFQSNRNFNGPKYEDLGTSFIYTDTSVMLALPLRADVENPLLPKIDEVTWDEADEDEKDDADKDGEAQDEDQDEEEESSADPISGTWTFSFASDLIPSAMRTATFVLSLGDNGEVTGVVKTPEGELDIQAGQYDAATKQFSCEVQSPAGAAMLQGTIEGNKLTGKLQIKALGIDAPLEGTREGVSSDEEADDEADESKDDDEQAEPFSIDYEDADARVLPLPIEPGQFGGMAVNSKGHLIYSRRGNNGPPSIKIFEITADDPKEKMVLGGAGSFQLSADGKQLLVRTRGGFYIVSAAAGQSLKDKISTDAMRVSIDPRAEWKQIFTDAWRMQRDFFYDPTMHGVDWVAVRQQYEKLLDDATSRSDVGFIIGEMISELNVGHAYYRGVRDGEPGPDANVGLLGCRFEATEGAYQVAELYQGGPWDTDARNPLVTSGVKVGQFILDVDGRPLTADQNPYAVFEGLEGQLVSLTISDDAKLDDEDKKVAVKLLGNDSNLRFRAWIEQNRQHVEDKSDGRIGYIYVVNTGVPGQNDLVRQFYAQLGKDALIIDDRWNGGGQIPTRFIELLNRPTTNYWARRDGRDWRWPPDSHQGPKCMLINGLAGSGGDMFPALFRQNKLGKLIGRRTWGGLVGITGGPALIDGASVTVPSFAYYETDGTWGIEGHGVDPDIEVVDDPALMLDGGDPQLDAAIKHLLEELETKAATPPARPAYPNRAEMGIPEEDR